VKAYRITVLGLAFAMLAAIGTATAAEVDWWLTRGAAVVEYTDGPHGRVCSLFFYGRNDAAVLTWTKNGGKTIKLYNDAWHFVPDRQVAVSLRIGDTWLATPAGAPPAQMTAITSADHLSVTVQQPLLPLLQAGGGITARMGDRTMTAAVEPFRIRKILQGVRRCRAAVARE
jgi:hypothetical protein